MSMRGKARNGTGDFWRPRAYLAFLFLFIASSVWGQTYRNLSQARQAASSAKTADSLTTVLKTAITQLPVRDSIALCEEFEPKVPAAFKAELRGTVGGLYLLLGQINDAKSWYAKAAGLDKKYTMQALRLAIMAGDQKTVLQLLKSESLSRESQEIAAIWISLLDGEYSKASATANQALSSTTDPQSRREILFLKYIADFGLYGTANSSILKEFPLSIEADMIQGKVFSSAPLILSVGLSWLGSPTILADLAQKNLAKQDNNKSDSGQWLQVGYFSAKENAERLSRNLSAKGYQTRIVETKNSNGDSRWAVHVAAKDDWQKTQSMLKDQGYESYLVQP
ncbi:exported hypothetical protein [uncultured spirochete]|uniref:SPOR domain-containing protein n=2 Tax=Spirochaetales TaxID=136 RepID=A0A3P3XFY3_9SPIR|nr:exported hypothetical protein [uncultured spirochete]HCX96877.1 hypothetical protein [Spirochaetaceae bacterium]